MAKRGRRTNYDARLGNLLDQIRDTIIAREQAQMDRRVSEQIHALVSRLDTAGLGGPDTKSLGGPDTKSRKPEKRGSYKRSPAQRKAQAAKMRAYWAAKRVEKAKKG
jgi:hypothetical protein